MSNEVKIPKRVLLIIIFIVRNIYILIPTITISGALSREQYISKVSYAPLQDFGMHKDLRQGL